MHLKYLLLVGLLITLMAACVKTGKLTFTGSLAAGLIGVVVYLALDFKGIAMLFVFFILSVLATAHRKSVKMKLHPSHAQTGGRTAGQVFANGGIAALASILVFIDPTNKSLYAVMMACSLASALSDTLSSELGIIYGRRFYNILTFKKDINGLDGVISLEGSLIGLAGAAFVAIAFSGFTITALVITSSGMLGNLVDSVLGATLERKHFIGNNLVNFLNTSFAAVIGALLYLTYPSITIAL